MYISVLKSKIHRATVTDANISYVGSITIDKNLMQLSNIQEYEKVLVADVNNGSRVETYAIAGEPGSGQICMNGAAARCCNVGDVVIIMAFGLVEAGGNEADQTEPKIVFVDENNKPIE